MNPNLDGYTISFENADQQPARIHAYLARSYWAEGIPLDLVKRSIAGSLCCGVFRNGEQVAFSRVVTDRATFAYLCDVYVLEEHRGLGIARWMMESLLAHPDLKGLRRFMLATRDAHKLYETFGFAPPARPQTLMEICRPGIYLADGPREPSRDCNESRAIPG